MTQIDDIIIIGGGISISEGLALGLQAHLVGKCVELTNYSYKHFSGTFLTFMDRDYYVPTHAKSLHYRDKYPDIYSELAALPLIIRLKSNPDLGEFKHPNTYEIANPKKEITSCPLTGLFALAIAEKLEPKTIFLLGYDWTRQPIPQDIKKYNPNANFDIHYYKKEIQHRGDSYTGYYDRHEPDGFFNYFKSSKSKIYNVSPNSNISSFEKIDYPTMLTLLSDVRYNQDELRAHIKTILQL